MSPFTTVRLALLGLISLGVGAICLKAYLRGDGWVHVIFPPGDIGKLLVDGREVKPNSKESRAHSYTIPQGSHRVSIESSATAHVVADIPCAQLADSDESILDALGE